MVAFPPPSLRGVYVRRMFGADCFFAPNGRMFAFLAGDRLFLRLPGPEYGRLLAAGGEPFMLRPGVPFGQWASLPTGLGQAEVAGLAEAAYHAALAEGPSRRHARRRRRGLQ
ncbi:MAG TPA: TfoX/Sxy family protein [Dehalococcoidia bacterium]|nr:TfoX/Sxy family protein [Dehalococcoidia bacterium]